MNKGMIEARLGDLDSAMSSFTKALDYNEGNPVAHFLLGLAHAHTQRCLKAKTQFEHCLKGLDTNGRGIQTYMNTFSIDALMVQENINHMQSRLIATAAGHGRTSHLRTRLHLVPAEVLFEPPPRSGHTSQRQSRSSTEQKLDFKVYEDSNERLQDPKSRATQPLHVDGHDVKSLHLVEDAEKNLTVAPLSDTVNDVRKHKRLAPRDPRVQDGSTQELAQFLRHAGPSGDANVTVDRKYMQRLLQGNRMDRTRLQSQVSTARDEFESLLGLYTGASSAERRSVPTTIDSSISDALSARQDDVSEHTITVGYERPIAGRERPLGSRLPTLESAQPWLRKEVQPLGLYKLSASNHRSDSARLARDHLRGNVSNDDRDVVSSTEMFTVGRSRR
jgi:hypothetical protein